MLAACGDAAPAEVERQGPPMLLRGEAQRAQLCARPNRDRVTDLFCGDSAPDIRGVVALREALGLTAPIDSLEQGFVLSGHSTSLVQRSVSAINPRIIFVRFEGGQRDDLAALAFARGERFTEIVVRNRTDGELQFYLARFQLPCDQTEQGCRPGDQLTEASESGWTALDMYGEEDLINTPLDCRVCHQPSGPGTPKILRMQELEAPWNHWFFRLSEGGQALLADYYAAKSGESLAGVPSEHIRFSQPGLLAFALFNASPPQDNLYVSREIEAEVKRSAAAEGGSQPGDNSVAGESATWRALYERASRGDAISVPYYNVKVSDPDKLAAHTEAYAAYLEGELAREDLPDIRDIYPDDPERLAHMGFVTEPGLSGEEVLRQACGQCHNQKLDQTISRSNFNIDLSLVSPEVRERAIARIQLDQAHPGAMPPALVRQLSDEGRQRLIELLQQ